MKTWNDYKEYVSSLSPELKADVEEVKEAGAADEEEGEEE